MRERQAADRAAASAAIPIRILHLEDDSLDAELVSSQLREDGLRCTIVVVATESAFRTEVASPAIELILSDYTIPSFSGLGALAIARSLRPDLPFIFVSGTIGEERAIEALKQGATDYVLKHRLSRLGPAIRRALAEKQARELGEWQTAQLAQTEKLAAMGSLLAGVAHELNNPLSVIVGHMQLLQGQLQGTAAERAGKVVSAADRCARIVKNFLALARHRPPERRQVHIRTVVEEALDLVGYSLAAAGVEVVTDIPPSVPALFADPHQLHQVLVNLLSNAQHALRGRAGTKRIVVSAGLHDDSTVFLEVGDNGPGIPPDIVGRVFEPFFTTKPVGEGTGLGLSLCREIVESHGGALRLQSEVEHGTVFRIELPVERPAVHEGASTDARSEPPRVGRILVVDDEVALAEMIAEMLSGQGHEVEIVTNGVDALEKLTAARYDAVLCDLRMPGMDGPALYAAVEQRRSGQERRFVFMTGDTFAAETAEFLQRAGVPSLSKPFRLEEIERTVRDAVGR